MNLILTFGIKLVALSCFICSIASGTPVISKVFKSLSSNFPGNSSVIFTNMFVSCSISIDLLLLYLCLKGNISFSLCSFFTHFFDSLSDGFSSSLQ